MIKDGLPLVSGYLNGENNSGIATTGTGLSAIPGALGQLAWYSAGIALALSNTSTGTLYQGLYQIVKFKSGTSASNAIGQIIFWDDLANFVVTPDASLAVEGRIAGVTLNTVAKGNYGVIQVLGKANVLFRSSITNKTDGNVVTQLTTTFTADAIADATGSYIGGGALGLKNIIGTCIGAPTDNVKNLVHLRNIPINYS